MSSDRASGRRPAANDAGGGTAADVDSVDSDDSDDSVDTDDPDDQEAMR
ncbi:MAG: hypothetical protein U0Q07_07420 [Acidimicrobiales bacterium]